MLSTWLHRLHRRCLRGKDAFDEQASNMCTPTLRCVGQASRTLFTIFSFFALGPVPDMLDS